MGLITCQHHIHRRVHRRGPWAQRPAPGLAARRKRNRRGGPGRLRRSSHL